MKVYDRTENGTTTQVSVREGLDEINAAMISPRKNGVREMSSITRTDYAITYRDGRDVRLVRAEAPEPAEETVTETDSAPWTVASHRTLLHRFTEATGNGRAVCNKSFRPWLYGNGYDFQTRAEHAASKYAHLYTFCPRCESK